MQNDAPDTIPPEPQDPCEHDWRMQDSSYSDGFGNVPIIWWYCVLCGDSTHEDPFAE